MRVRPQGRTWAQVAALCLFLSATALASERSELLYSRGLVDFHAGKYQAALQKFDEAVAADPADTFARYYRGITQARLGNNAAAVDDLKAALAAKPDLQQGWLELGDALVQTGQYDDAIPWLEKAQGVPALAADASFSLGLAQLRTGDLAGARTNFARAGTSDAKLDVPSKYYLGVTSYQAQDWAAAQTYFDSVIATNPDSAMAKESQAFLDKLTEGAAPLARPYTLYASLGLQYDSNVVLAPSDEPLQNQYGFGRQADGRVVLLAGGVYAARLTDRATLTLGYDFSQTLHFSLNSNNLMDNRPAVQFIYDAGPVRLGLLGQYDYYVRQTSSYLSQATALPWLSVPEGDFGRTEIYFRYRYWDFLEPDVEVLDGNNYSPGVRQYGYFGAPDRYAFLGYRFDTQVPTRTSGDEFGYNGNEVQVGGGWGFPLGIGAQLEFDYRYEDYDPASDGRKDNQYRILCSANKSLTSYLDLTLAYFGLFNDSNQGVYTYDRNIVSLAVTARY
ncbi:tetratricopeptide repeat protein [Candidatus Binatia bacterium]|nr:tetratricopeptide repeat protein [Candidatus Binatia bacterium]